MDPGIWQSVLVPPQIPRPNSKNHVAKLKMWQKLSKSKIEARESENSISMHERGYLGPKIQKMRSYPHVLYREYFIENAGVRYLRTSC